MRLLIRFVEAKVGRDRIRENQRRSLQMALQLYGAEQFTIVEIAE